MPRWRYASAFELRAAGRKRPRPPLARGSDALARLLLSARDLNPSVRIVLCHKASPAEQALACILIQHCR